MSSGLEHKPDVALLDIDISRDNSLGTVRQLNEAAPAMKVILFTARAEGDALIEAVRLGVRGVLLKSGASSVIFQCIRQVNAGAYWLEKQMTAAALGKVVRREAAQRQLSRAGLTPRELQIARLAGQGLPNLGIGTKLNISPATVKIHLHQIYRKLGLSGRIALMVYAHDNDLAARPLPGRARHAEQLRKIAGLRHDPHDVERGRATRIDRRAQRRAERGEQDERDFTDLGRRRLEPRDELEAIDVGLRHHHVEQHDVRRVLRDPLERLGAVVRRAHDVALALQRLDDDVAQARIVLDHEHAQAVPLGVVLRRSRRVVHWS